MEQLLRRKGTNFYQSVPDYAQVENTSNSCGQSLCASTSDNENDTAVAQKFVNGTINYALPFCI